jgi:hypothetical protein
MMTINFSSAMTSTGILRAVRIEDHYITQINALIESGREDLIDDLVQDARVALNRNERRRTGEQRNAA